MNGKRNPWEGVNLLPFIDSKRLMAAIAEFCPLKALTRDERARNTFGNVLLFEYDPTEIGDVPSCNREIGLKDINQCHSKMSIYKEPDRTNVTFSPEVIPGTKIPYPGFPSLNVLPIEKKQLEAIELNCFGTPSKWVPREPLSEAGGGGPLLPQSNTSSRAHPRCAGTRRTCWSCGSSPSSPAPSSSPPRSSAPTSTSTGP
jgi:hypothetical protein